MASARVTAGGGHGLRRLLPEGRWQVCWRRDASKRAAGPASPPQSSPPSPPPAKDPAAGVSGWFVEPVLSGSAAPKNRGLSRRWRWSTRPVEDVVRRVPDSA